MVNTVVTVTVLLTVWSGAWRLWPIVV